MRKGFAALAFVGVAATVALYALNTTTSSSVNFLAHEDDVAFI
jgi:cathepsin F